MKGSSELGRLGYEPRDARVGLVLTGGGLLVIGIVLSLMTAAKLYHRDGQSRRPVEAGRLFQFGAVAETSIARDWKAQDAAVRQHLQNYAWVDRAGGFVQIPIDRAIDLMAPKSAAPPKGQP
jgi:hypothetical protein